MFYVLPPVWHQAITWTNADLSETKIFLENFVNTMATDAIAPSIVRPTISSLGIDCVGWKCLCIP